MLQAIRKANPGSDFIYVVDTRPKVSVAVPVHVLAGLKRELGDEAKVNGLSSPLRVPHRQWGCSPLYSQDGAALLGGVFLRA